MKNKSMINMLICSVVIFSSTITSTFAACPDAKDVASAIKYKPFLNPGMSMTPTNGGEEFIIGEVARGSGTRTGTDAPKTLSVIDQAEQCHYREGKTMTGITFSIDLVPPLKILQIIGTIINSVAFMLATTIRHKRFFNNL